MKRKLLSACLFFLAAGFSGWLSAQTPISLPETAGQATPEADQATPTPVPELENAPSMDDLKAAQKEIGDLQQKRDETSIQYGAALPKNLGAVTRRLAREAYRTGDKVVADELQKEINDLEAIQKSEVVQDLALMEKKTHLKQLNLDRVLAFNRLQADKL
jgi:hypothetical protein